MGMYDNVTYECACPVCNAQVSGFQSKDKGCRLEVFEPRQVSNFYSSCDKCGCWIEFQSKHASFTRTVTGKQKGERVVLTQHTKEVLV